MDEEGAGASPWFWAGFVPGVVYVREGESRQGWSLPYCLIYFLNGFSADDSNPDENYGAVSLNDVLVQLSLLNIPRWGSGDDAWPGSRWDAAALPAEPRPGARQVTQGAVTQSQRLFHRDSWEGTAFGWYRLRYPWKCSFFRGRKE